MTDHIIDMIQNAARIDFVHAYNCGLNNAGLLSRTLMNDKSRNLASENTKVKRTAEKKLQKLIVTRQHKVMMTKGDKPHEKVQYS